MTTKSTLFSLATLLISSATLISCAKDETQTVNNQNTPAQTSTAVSYASIYSDESCTTPLVENVPLTGATTDINFVLSYGLDKVYMKYPTSEGTKVIALDVPQETVTKADPGSYTYFKYESDRYITLPVSLPEDAVKYLETSMISLQIMIWNLQSMILPIQLRHGKSNLRLSCMFVQWAVDILNVSDSFLKDSTNNMLTIVRPK